jgi:hypothetical protein
MAGNFNESDLGRILRGLPRESTGQLFHDGMEVAFQVDAADEAAAAELARSIVQMASSWDALQFAVPAVAVRRM